MLTLLLAWFVVAQGTFLIADIRGITDAVVDSIAAPGMKYSGIDVRERQLRIDSRTLFRGVGRDPSAEGLTLSTLRLRHAINESSEDILNDCSSVIRSPCNNIGPALLIQVQGATTVPESGGLVRVGVTLTYTLRRSASPSALSTPTYLAHSGFVAILERIQGGEWRVVRTENHVAS